MIQVIIILIHCGAAVHIYWLSGDVVRVFRTQECNCICNIFCFLVAPLQRNECLQTLFPGFFTVHSALDVAVQDGFPHIGTDNARANSIDVDVIRRACSSSTRKTSKKSHRCAAMMTYSTFIMCFVKQQTARRLNSEKNTIDLHQKPDRCTSSYYIYEVQRSGFWKIDYGLRCRVWYLRTQFIGGWGHHRLFRPHAA